MAHPGRSQRLDHWGLVAAMVDELGMRDVLDHATHQHPAMRIVTAGTAVTAMVRNGRGFVNQPLSRGPHGFQPKPIARLLASCIDATPLHDDPWGRALETLSAVGVTERYRLSAATAARRRGLAPPCAPLESTSVPVDGRYHREAEPAAQVMHRTRGSSRDHRPDRTHVRRDWMIAHQAGRPVLRPPLSGHSHETSPVGPVVSAPMQPLQTTSGTTDLVAASALDRAENLQQLSAPRTQWITRVPATWSAAHAALVQATPHTMAPLMAGYRDQALTSTDGGVEPRGVLLSAEPRSPPAQRTVDHQRRRHRAKAGQAFKHLCRMACACEAAAPQALSTFPPGGQATYLHEVA
jgi:Domain of unknown function (DUF4277)